MRIQRPKGRTTDVESLQSGPTIFLMSRRIAGTLVLLTFLMLPCVHGIGESDPFARPPSTPEAEGMEPGLLISMMDLVRTQNARDDSADTIDSVIVIRHGNVVRIWTIPVVKPSDLARAAGHDVAQRKSTARRLARALPLAYGTALRLSRTRG